MLDLVVLVSGSGSNLQAILDAIAAKALDAKVRLVVSNKDGVRALDRAAQAGVPTRVLSHKSFATREAYDAELRAVVELALAGSTRGWVVLAGFMRILTPTFLDAFPARVLNIHPALLPAFPGVHAQKQAVEYGVTISGCTVHLVDAGTDTGRILAQAAVPVLETDDEASLTARILAREHELFPRVLQWLADGRLTIVDGAPRYDGVAPLVFVPAAPAVADDDPTAKQIHAANNALGGVLANVDFLADLLGDESPDRPFLEGASPSDRGQVLEALRHANAAGAKLAAILRAAFIPPGSKA